MDVPFLVRELDGQIALLTQVRNLLTGTARKPTIIKKTTKRTMSAAARARIGAATRARWKAGKMPHSKKVA